MRTIGYSSKERPHKLPKDPKKREREQFIREYARNSGISIRAARAYWEDARSCRVCGCTDDDCSGCIEKTGEPCHWVDWDLCSACAAEMQEGGGND